MTEIDHPDGKEVECDTPKCPNKTIHPRKFCDECQILCDKIEYMARFLGFIQT